MKQTKNYEKFNKGLFIGLIVLTFAFIASIVWLSISQGDNAKLKAENKRLNIYNGILSTKLTEKTLEISRLQAQLGNLALANKDLEIENMILSNQVADTNKFLFPWGNSVTSRLEETMDFRPLTVLGCDDIACWLLEKAKEFREFYRGGK